MMDIVRQVFAPILVAVLLVVVAAQPLVAQEGDEDSEGKRERGVMTADRLGKLVLAVDEDAVRQGSSWALTLEGLEAIVVYDVAADRMRIMIPIIEAEGLEPDRLERLMQANFDSALDARYAIAQGMLWGTFIHPLSTLTDKEFLLGLGQTVNIVTSYGTSYSSGMFMYGGGDSAEIEQKELLERLQRETI